MKAKLYIKPEIDIIESVECEAYLLGTQSNDFADTNQSSFFEDELKDGKSNSFYD